MLGQAVLCTKGCLAASLASSPGYAISSYPTLWQSKMSSEVAKCLLDDKIVFLRTTDLEAMAKIFNVSFNRFSYGISDI